MIARAARPMSTILGRRLITFLLQLNGAGWGPGEAACEGWEKGGGEGSPHLGLDGRGQSILTQSFLQISHPLISNFVSYVMHNLFIPKLISSSGWLAGWNYLSGWSSDIWIQHVEACTTHLVPVCLALFCPFYPQPDCPPWNCRSIWGDIGICPQSHKHKVCSQMKHKKLNIQTHKQCPTMNCHSTLGAERGKGHDYHLRGAFWWTISHSEKVNRQDFPTHKYDFVSIESQGKGMNSKSLPLHSPYHMFHCGTCSWRSARQISASEEWRSALVITGESMWSALACIGCMGKLQTPNGPLTHLDIPIISLLRHRFFTPPSSHSLPLCLVHDRDFSFFRPFLAWLYCVVGMMGVSTNVKPTFLVPAQMDGASAGSVLIRKLGIKT